MQIDDHPEPHIHSQSLICVGLSLESDWSLCMKLPFIQIGETDENYKRKISSSYSNPI